MATPQPGTDEILAGLATDCAAARADHNAAAMSTAAAYVEGANIISKTLEACYKALILAQPGGGN